MYAEYIAMILVAIISAVGVIWGNHITTKPKTEDANINRINLMMDQYQRIIEENNLTIKHLKSKISEMKDENEQEIKEYKRKIENLKYENDSLERQKRRCQEKLKGGGD